jgi:predicted transcriptional regulator
VAPRERGRFSWSQGAESVTALRGSKMRIMNTAKDDVRRLLDRLPEEATFEDIQYQVYLLDEISRGSSEIDRGEGLDQDELKRRLSKWLEK